jgi:dihydrolipoamide dehydrogenase
MAEKTNRETELVVIGAGPGGYAAAFAAADRGMKVTLVDADDEPGGVCLNRGCIPSKTLLHIARVLSEAQEAKEWGVTFAPPQLDLDGIRKWKNDVISKNATGVRQLARARGVELVQAWATFKDAGTLDLKRQRDGGSDLGTLTFEHAIIAVGSRPATVPALAINSERVMDSTSALELPDIPKSLLVVGGGYIGLEMGTVYHAFGSEVSVVEMTEGLLPGADRDLVRVLEARLKKQFKQIMLKAKVVQMDDTGDAVAVTFDDGGSRTRVEKYDRVLISVGRSPNGKTIGLENTSVEVTERGFIKVDTRQRTAEPHIYAIGDVAGEPMLAHKASYEARIAVEVICGEASTFDARAIPAVVFTDPEVAWAGLNETQAKKDGVDVSVAKFPWGASGRATAIGRNDGLTKILLDPETKRVLGVGIVGVGAGELIAEAVLAIEMGATAEDVGRSIHAHPTLSETVMEGAELATGRTTHIFRPPR